MHSSSTPIATLARGSSPDKEGGDSTTTRMTQFCYSTGKCRLLRYQSTTKGSSLARLQGSSFARWISVTTNREDEAAVLASRRYFGETDDEDSVG